MDQAYNKWSTRKAQKQLMSFWDKQHPITEAECIRVDKIEAIQGNVNNIAKERCE
jgi:endonuclease I